MFPSPAFDIPAFTSLLGKRGTFARYRSRLHAKPEFANEFPVGVLADEILTAGQGQIKGMITLAGNPVLSSPEGEKLDRAFESLEFMVAVDIYINETTRHADIILPTTLPLEKRHMDVVFPNVSVRNWLKYSDAVIEPPAGVKHDDEILTSLVSRLLSWPARNRPLQFIIEKILRLLVPYGIIRLAIRFGKRGKRFNPFSKKLSFRNIKKARHGIDLGPLESQLPGRIFFKDKKIRLAPGIFLDDLARLKNVEKSDPAFNFQLIGRRQLKTNNSWMHNLPNLVKDKDLCTALIHPDDAAKLKITLPSPVRVTSKTGSIEITAEESDEVMQGVISIPHGFGHNREGTRLAYAEKRPGANYNELADTGNVDELVGTSVLNGIAVKIERIN